MQVRNLATGGEFGCSDEMGNRLLAEGGYEKVGAEPAAPKKAAPRRRTPKTESE